MRIGIDARKIRDFGIGRYIAQLIHYLPEYDHTNHYVIFHYPQDCDLVPTPGPRVSLIPDTSGKYSLRELIVLPLKMQQQRLDLFHAPHYTLPPVRPCPAVVTIHDVIHLKFPHDLPHPAAFYYARSLMWLAAHSAAKVLTVSECSKRDIMRYLHVPAEKIEVIYNGIDLPVIPSLPEARTGLRQRFGIMRPYLLYLGNCMPHKNLDTLIRAYGQVKRQQSIPHCLVLAGKNDRTRARLEAVIVEEHLQGDVILTGLVEPEWFSPLYACADLFVYPSLYEGFGLQVLEAMAHGVPVAISNGSSLPEIAGDAALPFDPTSAARMAAAIATLLNDQSLRAALIAKGNERIKLFSWRESARKTIEVYARVKLNPH